MPTSTYLDCVVTTPPPNPITFDGGPAVNGSCAAVQAAYPGDTVTITPITYTTGTGDTGAGPTTTTTAGPSSSCYVGCSPPGYAGISGGGQNCGAGSGGSCPVVMAPAATVAVPPATGLAFTGADIGGMAALGLVAVVIGVVLVRGARRRRRRPYDWQVDGECSRTNIRILPEPSPRRRRDPKPITKFRGKEWT